MVRFQIPPAFLPGFQHLLSFQPDEVEKIVRFLGTIPVGTGPKAFIELFTKATGKTDVNTRELASTIFSLGGLKFAIGEREGFDELVNELSSALQEQTKNPLSPDEAGRLQGYLHQILSGASQLFFTYKAFDLLAENSRVYRDAHVVTDMRPLFKADLSNPERHALILHQLKIEAEVNRKETHFYFSLSHADLLKLKDQIDRAVEKERLIRENYQQAIQFIEITE